MADLNVGFGADEKRANQADPLASQCHALASDCAAHLRHEHGLLHLLQGMTDEFRQAIRDRDAGRLDQLRDRQAKTNQALLYVTQQREEIRSRIARTLGVPLDRATVGQLAARCDETWRSALQEQQQQIRSMGQQLSVKLMANHNLAFQLLSLLDDIFRALSGDTASVATYEASGRRSVS